MTRAEAVELIVREGLGVVGVKFIPYEVSSSVVDWKALLEEAVSQRPELLEQMTDVSAAETSKRIIEYIMARKVQNEPESYLSN